MIPSVVPQQGHYPTLPPYSIMEQLSPGPLQVHVVAMAMVLTLAHVVTPWNVLSQINYYGPPSVCLWLH